LAPVDIARRAKSVRRAWEPGVDLPARPSKGNRRELEQAWIAQLEARGLYHFLPQPPDAVPPQVYVAVDQFNAGSFWDCHETLEEVWLETTYPLRFVYHALIKVAVGFHHLGRHNCHGARVKLSDGVRLLRLFPAVYMGVHTRQLLADTSAWLARIEGEARLDWAALDTLPRPTILTSPM